MATAADRQRLTYFVPGLVAPDFLLVMHGRSVVMHRAVGMLHVARPKDRLERPAHGRGEDDV